MTRGAPKPQRSSLPSPNSSSHLPSASPPQPSSPIDLVALPRCSFDELRARWRQCGGRGEPPAQKCLLLREIAWRAQSPNAQRGAAPSLAWGLDAQTARLLAAAVRSAERAAARSPARRGNDPADPDAPVIAIKPGAAASSRRASHDERGARASKSPRPTESPRHQGPPRHPAPPRGSARIVGELKPGSRLVRVWRGRTFEVEVIDDQRFRFAGREYSSLSEVARVITGTHWSGPRFFGIVARTRSGA